MTSFPPSSARPPSPPPLNSRQRAAIEHGDGPLMILAGAGTGKTRVLVHRIARLVESGIRPWEILAVTFTNKAAGEMRHRLRDLLGDQADAMWIGTFHAICARILRQYGDVSGLTKNFVVFDEGDQLKTIERILRDTGVASDAQARASAVLVKIDQAKNEGKIPASWRVHQDSHGSEAEASEAKASEAETETEAEVEAKPGEEAPPQPDPSTERHTTTSSQVDEELMTRVYPRYQNQLDKEDAVDFNDLLLRVLVLLDHPTAGPVLRTKFRHVLVDEFQDTNQVQYDLVWRLAEATRNFAVVGDDDQSIYAWRGAKPGNLLHLDRVLRDVRVVKLEQNYRSTQTILDVANRVISKNRARHDKALWTDQGDGPLVDVSRSDDERQEAHWVSRWIHHALGGGLRGLGGSVDRPEGYAPSDIAVLFRTNAQARVLEEYLRASRVPSRVVGATSFYDRREIRDALAYLRLLINPDADSALERVINVPARGIGEKTLAQIRAHAKVTGATMYATTQLAAEGGIATLGAGPRKKIQAFVGLVEGLRGAMVTNSSVSWIIIQVIERSGMAAKFQADGSAESIDRLGNLAELINAASDLEHAPALFPGEPGAPASASDPEAPEPTSASSSTFSSASVPREPGMDSPSGALPRIPRDPRNPIPREPGMESRAEASARAPSRGDPGAEPPDVKNPGAGPRAGASELAPSRGHPGAEPPDAQSPVSLFLERVSLASGDTQEGGAAASARAAQSCVSLMTIHAAKGLEWPVVIVTGMEDGLFPSLREREDATPGEAIEEERRLAYVAITRARERLVLTYARTRRVWGETQMQDPSRFLDDLPDGSLARPWEEVRDQR
jgi:DNA helicase-2/ATP-dependent DNA helicase PcrA